MQTPRLKQLFGAALFCGLGVWSNRLGCRGSSRRRVICCAGVEAAGVEIAGSCSTLLGVCNHLRCARLRFLLPVNSPVCHAFVPQRHDYNSFDAFRESSKRVRNYQIRLKLHRFITQRSQQEQCHEPPEASFPASMYLHRMHLHHHGLPALHLRTDRHCRFSAVKSIPPEFIIVPCVFS
jgi:hypothetical protein